MKATMAALTTARNQQKQADLLGRGGDQLGHQNLFHVVARIGRIALPANDRVGQRACIKARSSRSSTALTLC